LLDSSSVVQAPQHDLTPHQLDNVRKVFDAIDANESGTIEFVEFKMGLQALGMKMSDEDAGAVFNSFDMSGDSKLQFEEYVALIQEAAAQISACNDGVGVAGPQLAPGHSEEWAHCHAFDTSEWHEDSPDSLDATVKTTPSRPVNFPEAPHGMLLKRAKKLWVSAAEKGTLEPALVKHFLGMEPSFATGLLPVVKYETTGAETVVVAFDFDPEAPPGWPFPQHAALPLRRGQEVRIVKNEADSFWSFGELVENPSVRGWFPRTYTEPVPSPDVKLAWPSSFTFVAVIASFDPATMDWPVPDEKPLPLAAGQVMQIILDDVDSEWSWGHPVGEPSSEGFIAKAFTAAVSFKMPLERGSHVLVVQDTTCPEPGWFAATDIAEWPPEKPLLKYLQTGQVMQLTVDEDPNEECLFGHVWGQSDAEGHFPKEYTVPIEMSGVAEQCLLP